ncbi:MAG: isoprenylcysteine carboxylmethyltransferase family protein [Chloroflexota bacterium]
MSTQAKVLTPRTLIRTAIIVILFPSLPLIISGRWDWWEAWVYAILSTVGFVVSRVLAARQNPDIIEERARSMDLTDAKSWDRILAPLVALGGVIVPVTAGLDKYYEWSAPFAFGAKIAGLVLIILGYLLGSWALVENRFFSGVVRIQKDRGHTVVSSGPYRFVRHPGYAGALLAYLATPVLLDSVWAFIPALFLSGVLVVRTALEDKTLQAELPGYKEFTQKTRYRLIPGIW